MPIRRTLSCVLAALAGPVLALWVASVPAEVRIGVVNERPDRPDLALSQYGALHGWLEGRLASRGIALGRLVIAQSISEMIDRLRAGEVEAVIEGVVPTLRMEQQTGLLSPELVAWRKGQRQYTSVFFVRRDSPIQSLSDLAGRTIAFEAPRSTSAYFVPWAALLEHGLAVRPLADQPAPDAVSYVFAGSELNQGYWVHQRRADAGAFNDGDWERTPAHLRADLRIIATTRPLLRWLFSLRTDLDPAVRAAILEELSRAHEDSAGREALETAERIARFEPLTTEDREGIEHWRHIIGRMPEEP